MQSYIVLCMGKMYIQDNKTVKIEGFDAEDQISK